MRCGLSSERMALPVFMEKALANEEEQLLGKMSPHSAWVLNLQLPLLEAASCATDFLTWCFIVYHCINYDALIVHFV